MNATMTIDPVTVDPVYRSSAPQRQRQVPSSRTAAGTYRRRRAAVGGALAIVVAFGSVVTHDVLVGSGGVPASAAESRPAQVRSTTTAQPGDTLWSIAQTHRGGVPIHRYVDKLVDLNGGASIQAGQQVVLP